MKCKDCKWWFELPEEGQCRRHSPRLIVAGCGIGEVPEYSNDWATVGKDDWCSELEAKKIKPSPGAHA